MDKTTIKQWFSKGKKPTEQQFHATFDSFWHKDDVVEVSNISGLSALLANKSNVNHGHTTKDIDGLDAALGEATNSKMNIDGSNYVSSLALVTPIISSTWKIKKQDGTQVSTSTANSLTVENGAKVDYSGTSSQPAPSASQTAPTAISGDFGTIASGSKEETDITANTTFRVTYTAPKSGLEVSGTKVVKASGNQQTSASASVAFSHKIYWGASANPNLEDFSNLDFVLSNNRGRTIDFDCSGGKYFYYAYPKALGTATWKVGGLAFTGYELTEKTITNEYGLPVAYYVYRSTNLQTGSSINAVIS